MALERVLQQYCNREWWWCAFPTHSRDFQPQAGLLWLRCFGSQHLLSHLSLTPQLMASEPSYSHPESAQSQVLDWVAVVTVALIAEPRQPISGFLSGKQALAHAHIFNALSSVYTLTHTCFHPHSN